MKGLIFQGMLHVSLMMSAPFAAAAPAQLLQEGLGLTYMIHDPGTLMDQATPRELSLYRELAAIPDAQGVTGLKTVVIDGDSLSTADDSAVPQFFLSGLARSRVGTYPSAFPDTSNGGQVSMSSVPIPGALSLFLTGLLCAAVVARKKLISYRREAILD